MPRSLGSFRLLLPLLLSWCACLRISEVSGSHPIRARRVYLAASTTQFRRQLLALGEVACHMHNMAAAHVAKLLDVANLHEHGSVRVSGESHTGLEQNIWPSLSGRRALIGLVCR